METFKPKKDISPRRISLKEYQMQTLGLGNFKEAVKLPLGEDLFEWYAVNIVDFYNQILMLYSTITDFCSNETCPIMQAGPSFKYLWADKKNSKTVEISAPSYIKLLFDWIEEQIDNEQIFPSIIGEPFPKNFELIIKEIMRRLFRVYAHCYYHHMEHFSELNELAHLNTSFKHFIFFVTEFNLIQQEQLEPLKNVIDPILNPSK